MNLDDKSLFLDAMEDVQPLKRNNDVHWHPGRNSRARSASIPCSWIIFSPPAISISCRSPRRWSLSAKGCKAACWISCGGEIRPAGEPLLLRQPVEQCRQMLFAFMVQAQKEGLRNVLIVHGKGRDDQSHANIIRSYLARWLEELPEVQAFCAALPHHGGSGVLCRAA
jgi:DNA-nicking Smr family endonuclease